MNLVGHARKRDPQGDSMTIVLTERKLRLLGALIRKPRDAFSFTGGEMVDQSIAPIHIMRYLSELWKAELVDRRGETFSITPAGIQAYELAQREKVECRTPPRTWSHFLTDGNYTGTKWNIREGGLDNLRHRSHGSGC
jgi:hypothetical protein